MTAWIVDAIILPLLVAITMGIVFKIGEAHGRNEERKAADENKDSDP